ncbi:MAG: DUF4293 domain-containing protein [Cyclobacteriaceae bacterium]|nr:DUF4293 domain-containing protein [Cyclobacteriaceae bacterium]
MIQRIQTIFLFLVVVLLITFNFLPYWQSNAEDITLFSYGYQFTNGENLVLEFGLYTAVAVLSSIGALVALIEIFMHKNRMLQMMMSVINSFIMMITIGLMAYFIYELQKSTPGKFEPGSFTLAMAMFMNILARRFIQKDENLVRSVDRIR